MTTEAADDDAGACLNFPRQGVAPVVCAFRPAVSRRNLALVQWQLARPSSANELPAAGRKRQA